MSHKNDVGRETVTSSLHRFSSYQSQCEVCCWEMEEEREAVEGVKLHRKGRVMKAQSVQSEDDVFLFQGGGRSTGIVKFLEPLSPLLNYFEVVNGVVPANGVIDDGVNQHSLSM